MQTKILKIFGGKHYIFKKNILPLLNPNRKMFVSPCCGGISEIWDTPFNPNVREAINDLDPELINFYRVLRETPNLLKSCLDCIDYNEYNFEKAKQDDSTNPFTRAVNTFIKNRMSRDGLGKVFAWSDRLRRGMPEQVSSYKSAIEAIPWCGERLKYVELYNKNALEIIEMFKDEPDATWYFDPSYPSGTRRTKNVYFKEMTNEEHVELLVAIGDIKGQVIISSYRNLIYDSMLEDWRSLEIPVKVNMGASSKKSNRIEVIYYNR